MFFSTPVLAVEPITGAFGVKLGDVWDGEATKTDDQDGWFSIYFIPDLPHDLFDTYSVNVTPAKNLIFGIMGTKKGACEQYQDLKKALIKKYGAGEEFDEFRHSWGQGNRKLSDDPTASHARTIGIRCDAVELSIYYMDWHIRDFKDLAIEKYYMDWPIRDVKDSLADELPDTSNL